MLAIIEGIDRIGKSTCASHLVNMHGFARFHFGKPEGDTTRDRAMFQKGSFKTTMPIFAELGHRTNIVLDRAHLGESVYGPIYRGDSGVDLGYLNELEQQFDHDEVAMVLVVHRDLELVRSRDDGEGYDAAKNGEEQDRFVAAFKASKIYRKHALDVTDLDIQHMLRRLEMQLGLPDKTRWL